MKRFVLILAGLLAPTVVMADPISAIALISSIGAEYLVAEAMIFGTLTGFVASAATAVVAMGISMIASEVLGLSDVEAPALDIASRGQKINTETTNAAIPVVYGRATVGGNIDLRDLGSGSTTYLYNVISFCEGEVEEIVDLFFDGESMTTKDIYRDSKITYPGILSEPLIPMAGLRITIDGVKYQYFGANATVPDLVSVIQADSNYATQDWTVSSVDDATLRVQAKNTGTTAYVLSNSEFYPVENIALKIFANKDIDWRTSFADSVTGVVHSVTETTKAGASGLYYVELYTGSDTQAASQELIDSIDYWTSAHQGKGVAYAVVRLKYNRDNFIGIPQITADIMGQKVDVWNGSTWTKKWSDNPAWCIRDYMTNSRYGQGIDANLIDLDSFYAAAQYCDSNYSVPEYSTTTPSKLGLAVPRRYGDFHKENTENAWDSAVISDEAYAINQVDDQEFRFSVDLCGYDSQMSPLPAYPGGRVCSVGISSNSSSLDPDTAELSVRIKNTDTNEAFYYDIVESGVVVYSGIAFTTSQTPAFLGDGVFVNTLFNNAIRIEYLNGTAKYYILGSLVHASTVNVPNGNYYMKGYLYDSFNPFNANEFIFPAVRLVSARSLRRTFRLNGKVDTSRSPYDNVKELLTSCRGMLVWSSGKFKMLIDKKETYTPTFTFNEDNIVGSWSIDLGSKQNTFNKAKAHFLNKTLGHDADVMVIDNTAIRASEDNGLVLEKDIHLPFTTDPYDAQILGTMILNQSRNQIACSFTATIEALEVEIGDIVYITHSTPGWTNKKFRIMRLEIKPNQEVSVGAMEYFDSSYDFTTTLIEETPKTTNALSSPYFTETPSNVVAAIGAMKLDATVNISWDAPSSGSMVDHYEIRVVGTAAGDNNSDFRVTTKQTQYNFPSLTLGDYEFTVEAVNNHGVHSDSVIAFLTIEAPVVPNVSGLEIDLGEDGEANGTTWTGADCKIKWRASSQYYSYEMNDEEPYGADSGGPDHFIKDYQIEVRNGSGVLLRTEYVTDTWYSYTQEKNLEDARKQPNATVPYRDLQFSVWTRGYFGQISEQAAKL